MLNDIKKLYKAGEISRETYKKLLEKLLADIEFELMALEANKD